MASTIPTLAEPKVRHKAKVTLEPKIGEDATVRHIAQIMLASARFQRTSEDFTDETNGIFHYLRPYGIGIHATRMALGLTHTEGGYRRGTAHAPNARLAQHGAKTVGNVLRVRDNEVYYRAAYVANAAQRIQRSLDDGATQVQALRRERPYYQAHEHARRGRLNAAAQVQRAAEVYGWPEDRGHLVGWYLNPMLHNDLECKVAAGHNFYAEEGTVIGLPGSVHNNCGCYAGPPHVGRGLVNDQFRNIVKLDRHAKPKFKLRERSA